ncbi:MAG: glycosyltransferase family 2 protein [Solirubrobacteraceae bacterium]
MNPDTLIIVTARDEADRIEATLAAIARAFPGCPVWVADDGSGDGTATLAARAGATVVSAQEPLGKGGAATLAARQLLAAEPTPCGAVVLLCDGDLGESAQRLGALVDAVRVGDCDLAVAAFSRRAGGGFGLALGFARWAIARRCGLRLNAPISGQRAIRASALDRLLPFAHGFGMEIGMTIAAARAGLRVGEIEIDLSHRVTGKSAAGFVHRARQLRDFVKVYRAAGL